MKIICERCNQTIVDESDDELAEEMAQYEEDAHQHPESGDWTCDKCYQAEMAYWMHEARVLKAESEVARQARDPLAYWRETKGE